MAASPVVYCGVCTVPPEYCEFGSTLDKCKTWLLAHHSELFGQLYPEDPRASTSLDQSMQSMSLDVIPTPETTAAPVEAPTSKKDRKKEAALKVILKRVERTKRKRVIHIIGLHNYTDDLKKTAKSFANKFACGSSVTKNASGIDEIVVQGDVLDQLLVMLPKDFPNLESKNLVVQESAKKKTAEGEAEVSSND